MPDLTSLRVQIFADGADLADMSVIKGFAQECGLNWDEMSSRLESGYYRKQVLEQ